MRFIRNPKGKGGYLRGKHMNLAYRGFKPRGWTTYFSLKPIHIGSTKLYTLGPVALFIKGKS